MNENPGLGTDARAARERDLIRRKQLGRLGTRRRHPRTQHDRDADRATIPLSELRAVHKRR